MTISLSRVCCFFLLLGSSVFAADPTDPRKYKRAQVVQRWEKDRIVAWWRFLLDPTGQNAANKKRFFTPLAEPKPGRLLVDRYGLDASKSFSSQKHLVEEKLTEGGVLLLGEAFSNRDVDTIVCLLGMEPIQRECRKVKLLAKVWEDLDMDYLIASLCRQEKDVALLHGLLEVHPELRMLPIKPDQLLPYEITERYLHLAIAPVASSPPPKEDFQLLALLDPASWSYAAQGAFYFSKYYLTTLVEEGLLDRLLELGLGFYGKKMQNGQPVYRQCWSLWAEKEDERKKVVAVMVWQAGIEVESKDLAGVISRYVGWYPNNLSPTSAPCKAFEAGEFVAFQKVGRSVRRGGIAQ